MGRNPTQIQGENSYKKDVKKKDDATGEQELIDEIEKKKVEVFSVKEKDVFSQKWKEHVWNALWERMAASLKSKLDADPKLKENSRMK